MKSKLQLQPMVLAVSGALALMAGTVVAQTFDLNSAVRGAYVGEVDREKFIAAIFGFADVGGKVPALPNRPNFTCFCLSQIGTLSDLVVPSGSTVDLSGPAAVTSYRTVTGAGTVQLGGNTLEVVGGRSNFSGSIVGVGGLRVSHSSFGLSGVNTYTGSTRISDASLSIIAAGKLDPGAQVSVFAGISSASFDLVRADGPREIETLTSSTDTTIDLGANTLTVGRNGTSSSIRGSIVGSGSLVKEGFGVIEILGPNTLEGSLIVNGGLVRARAGGLGSQAISGLGNQVINNATLVLVSAEYSDESFSVYSGAISGTGQLIKEGTHAVWLRGRHTYSGGTEINQGALIGNTESLQGNIINNSQLAFYQVDNGTYAGTLSGTGALLQYGPGVLALSGNNTYTGGTAFSGTIRVDRDANLGASCGGLTLVGGTLQLGADITTARTVNLASGGGTVDTNGFKLNATGNIAGVGGLTKIGLGTLSLSGVNTYTGATAVNAGRLAVDGSITSDVTVAAGAELGGTGLISGNVINSGRLSRGDGIGAINVAGNVSFAPGSVFTVRADAGGNSDRLLLSGASSRATVNGGTVDVRAETGNYRLETRYGIVNAAGGVTGQFTGVASNLAFLDPSLSYDPNNVYLTLKRNDINYTAVAQTLSQMAVAQSLVRISTAPTGDAATISGALNSLSASQARAAFDSIGAAGRATLPQVGTFNQRAVNQNLVARLGIAEGGNSLAPATGLAGRAVQLAFDERIRSDAPTIYAQAMVPGSGQGLRAGATSDNNGLWLRGYGGAGRLDGDANSPGAK